MIPSEVHIILWLLKGGRVMTTLTNKGSYCAWLKDAEGYADKRLQRYNNQAVRRDGTPAVGLHMERYVRAS